MPAAVQQTFKKGELTRDEVDFVHKCSHQVLEIQKARKQYNKERVKKVRKKKTLSGAVLRKWNDKLLLHTCIRCNSQQEALFPFCRACAHNYGVELRMSADKGGIPGPYAVRGFEPKKLLLPYAGDTLTEAQRDALYGEEDHMPYVWEDEHITLDAALVRSWASMVNTEATAKMCNMKAFLQKSRQGYTLWLYNHRTINTGDELTWYYGKQYSQLLTRGVGARVAYMSTSPPIKDRRARSQHMVTYCTDATADFCVSNSKKQKIRSL